MEKNIYGEYELLLGQVYMLSLTSASQPGIDMFAPEPQHTTRATRDGAATSLSSKESVTHLLSSNSSAMMRNHNAKVEST